MALSFMMFLYQLVSYNLRVSRSRIALTSCARSMPIGDDHGSHLFGAADIDHGRSWPGAL